MKNYVDTQHEVIALNQISLSAFDTEHPLPTLITRHIQFSHHRPIHCTFIQCLDPGSLVFFLLRKVRISSVLQRQNFILIYEHQLSPSLCLLQIEMQVSFKKILSVMTHHPMVCIMLSWIHQMTFMGMR